MRGIFVGVAAGGTRTSSFRNEDEEGALCSVCCALPSDGALVGRAEPFDPSLRECALVDGLRDKEVTTP